MFKISKNKIKFQFYHKNVSSKEMQKGIDDVWNFVCLFPEEEEGEEEEEEEEEEEHKTSKQEEGKIK